MANNNIFRRLKNSRFFMISTLITIDCLSILFSFSISLVFWNRIKQDIFWGYYINLIPLLILFIIAFAMMGLYSTIGQSPIIEFRSIIIASTIVFLILSTLTFVFKQMNVYSRAVFLFSWVFCLLITPTVRKIAIRFLCDKNIWGEEVIIIGLNKRTADFVQLLVSQPEFGFVPIFILNFSLSEINCNLLSDIPVFTISKDLDFSNFGQSAKISTAIILEDDSDQEIINHFQTKGFFHFKRIIVIPHKQLSSLWVTPFDIGGTLGFEIKQNLLNFLHQKIKRTMDLAIVILASPFILIFSFMIALAIKLDTNGPVFYKETRIGYSGKSFSIWKFRTMVENADEQLNYLLENISELENEWRSNHKLKNDPRITRTGRILRRFSLDELPQIINIIRNEMSLVGPRPIVKDEVSNYGNQFELYKKVRPGLTGLWQVSGRNDLSYENRVELDEFYVRNYSIWMDLYIIYQTVNAVLSNRGAY